MNDLRHPAERHDPLDATMLPPIEQIEKFLPDGGMFSDTTEEGWAITGFLLK